MQERDCNRRFIQMHIGEDRSDFERMGEIGIAGSTFLTAMLLHGIDICLVEKRLVHVRLVSLNTLHKLILAHHLRELPFETDTCTCTHIGHCDPKSPKIE